MKKNVLYFSGQNNKTYYVYLLLNGLFINGFITCINNKYNLISIENRLNEETGKIITIKHLNLLNDKLCKEIRDNIKDNETVSDDTIKLLIKNKL